MAAGDLDNDGDVDLVVFNNSGPARVLLNEVGSRRHWLGVRVRRRRDTGATRCRRASSWCGRGRARASGACRPTAATASASDPRVRVRAGQRDARRRPFACTGRAGEVEEFRGPRRRSLLGARARQAARARVRDQVVTARCGVASSPQSGRIPRSRPRRRAAQRRCSRRRAPDSLPVPFPPLDALEPAVAEQIREAQQTFERAGRQARRPREGSGRRLRRARPGVSRLRVLRVRRAAYANAARLAPGDGQWPHLLGYLYQQTGRLEEAAEQFAAARRAAAGRSRGSGAARRGVSGLNRLRDAREQFEQCVGRLPGAGAQRARRGRAARAAVRGGDRHFRAVARARAAGDGAPLLAGDGVSRPRPAGRGARRTWSSAGRAAIRVGDPLVDGLQTLVRGERGLGDAGPARLRGRAVPGGRRRVQQALDAAPVERRRRASISGWRSCSWGTRRASVRGGLR